MTERAREAAAQTRVERQRAAKALRRKRDLMVAGAALGVIAIAGAAYAAWLGLAARQATAPGPSAVATSTAEPTRTAEPSATVETTASTEPTAVASAPATVTVIGVGDMLFDHGPRRLIAAQGGRAPLSKVESLLMAADVTIGNLEGPLSNRGAPVAGKDPAYIFEGDPRAVEGLTASGFDLLALANNHVMDHGVEALTDTLTTLDSAGIAHAGAGMNAAAAWKPAIIERNGKRIAFLSFSQVVPLHFAVGPKTPGLASGYDMKRCVAAIRAAKKEADYVIVSYHWGIERSYTMNAGQVRDARRSIDAGADMVLSHHPHVMQPIEFYKGKLIAYSLANFVFPYKTAEGRKSIILRASLGPGGVTDVSVVPVTLGEYGRPAPQTGADAAAILGKLRDISAPRGTRVIIEGDTARIVPK